MAGIKLVVQLLRNESSNQELIQPIHRYLKEIGSDTISSSLAQFQIVAGSVPMLSCLIRSQFAIAHEGRILCLQINEAIRSTKLFLVVAIHRFLTACVQKILLRVSFLSLV